MGENEGWAQPSGIFSNGLLPNAGPLIQVLESETWLKAEERTAELIACIQPNQPSEEQRNAVADYVQRLIIKCFLCQTRSPSKAAGMFSGTQEKCATCGKTAYPLEKIRK